MITHHTLHHHRSLLNFRCSGIEGKLRSEGRHRWTEAHITERTLITRYPSYLHAAVCSSLYSAILYSTLISTPLYSSVLYSSVLYSTLLYSTPAYSTLLYSTLLYSTPLCYIVWCAVLSYSSLCSVYYDFHISLLSHCVRSRGRKILQLMRFRIDFRR